MIATLAFGAGVAPVARADEQIAQPTARSAAPSAAAQSSDAERPYRAHAATAFSPSLNASSDTCMGSRSVGMQGVGFGASLGTTWRVSTCRRLKNARALDELGYTGAAVELLCMDRQVRAAMLRAGTPCAAQRMPHIEPIADAPVLSLEQLPEIALLARYAVLFDFDSARLKPEADIILQPLLARLLSDPSFRVNVEGHADWVGSDAYNLRLSLRRAQAVVAWLVAHGVARDRLTASGKGESEPLESNRTAAGRAQNRRVDVWRAT